MNIRHIPFLYITLPYLTGLYCARLWSSTPLSLWVFSLVLLAVALCSAYRVHTDHTRLHTILLVVVVFILGQHRYLSAEKTTGRVIRSTGKAAEKRLATAVITSFPKTKKYHAVEAKMEDSRASMCFKAVKKVVLYIHPTVPADSLLPGRLIAIKTSFFHPDFTTYPHGFDYNQYLRDRGIHLTAFVHSGDIRWIPESENTSLFNIRPLRSYIFEILKRHFSGNTLGTMTSLILGDRHLLNARVEAYFREAGAIHVLAVSGLHVGIITYLLLLGTRNFLRPGPLARWFRLVTIATVLFYYCQLTGNAPPVKRASFMFGLYSGALVLGIRIPPVNSLLATAFMFVWVNPYTLFQVGFQLSFVAVLSILVFYKPIIRCLKPRNPFLAHIWGMVAVGLSAQILVLPLTTFYFYDIPVYFFISSVLAVLLIQVLLVAGLALIAIDVLLPAIGSLFADFISILTEGLIMAMGSIAHLPFHTVRVTWLTTVSVLGIYFLIACFYRFLTIRTYRSLLTFLVGLLVFCSYHSLMAAKFHYQSDAVVYPGDLPCMDIVEGHRVYQICDPLIDSSTLQRMTMAYRRHHRINEVRILHPPKPNNEYYEIH